MSPSIIILPFTADTAKKFLPEKRATERLRNSPSLHKSLCGNFNGVYQQTYIFTLEILLDKACSRSGASTIRNFQSLTRCLTDVDHAALTSNSFEFLKVLIEEEINLDSISSIRQMLIRMNKSFEKFIPVRFCELILAAGSPEIVKLYFRVLAKLETQLHPLSLTQHIIKYIPKLLQWCPRPTLGLLKDWARSVHVTTWALQNLDVWVKQFLIAENNYSVSLEAAEILMMLIPDNAQLYKYWKSYVEKFNVLEKHSFDHDKATLAVIHKILNPLLNMLEEFPSLTGGKSFHKRRGVSQYVREAYGHTKRKGRPQIA